MSSSPIQPLKRQDSKEQKLENRRKRTITTIIIGILSTIAFVLGSKNSKPHLIKQKHLKLKENINQNNQRSQNEIPNPLHESLMTPKDTAPQTKTPSLRGATKNSTNTSESQTRNLTEQINEILKLNDPEVSKITTLETLLSQPDVLNNLDETQKKELLDFAKNLNSEKYNVEKGALIDILIKAMKTDDTISELTNHIAKGIYAFFNVNQVSPPQTKLTEATPAAEAVRNFYGSQQGLLVHPSESTKPRIKKTLLHELIHNFFHQLDKATEQQNNLHKVLSHFKDFQEQYIELGGPTTFPNWKHPTINFEHPPMMVEWAFSCLAREYPIDHDKTNQLDHPELNELFARSSIAMLIQISEQFSQGDHRFEGIYFASEEKLPAHTFREKSLHFKQGIIEFTGDSPDRLTYSGEFTYTNLKGEIFLGHMENGKIDDLKNKKKEHVNFSSIIIPKKAKSFEEIHEQLVSILKPSGNSEDIKAPLDLNYEEDGIYST